MADQIKADRVYFGTIDDMIAEVGALDMGAEWFKANRFRYAVLAHGNANFDTDFFTAKKDAKAYAFELAGVYGCKVAHV